VACVFSVRSPDAQEGPVATHSAGRATDIVTLDNRERESLFVEAVK
jgi:hypothetical protein